MTQPTHVRIVLRKPRSREFLMGQSGGFVVLGHNGINRDSSMAIIYALTGNFRPPDLPVVAIDGRIPLANREYLLGLPDVNTRQIVQRIRNILRNVADFADQGNFSTRRLILNLTPLQRISYQAYMGFRGHEVHINLRGAPNGIRVFDNGYLNFPGGVINPGETPIQSAVREFQEEIGINITEDNLLNLFTVRVNRGDGIWEYTRVYTLDPTLPQLTQLFANPRIHENNSELFNIHFRAELPRHHNTARVAVEILDYGLDVALNKYYKHKYLKYKHKYLNLKHKYFH